ncbi:MAG: glycosyltransferase family 39 protein, partial [Chloroflexi bacterium]|nr:glycosyltransferase family 39 protein [Chloroflexota bacterium]
MRDGRPPPTDDGAVPAVHRRSSVVGGALVLALFVLWSAAHLDGFSWDYDEGTHVYIAWLMQRGHALYTQTFSPYTPGLTAALVAAFNVFGASVFVARMVTVLCAALGMWGVMLAARELIRPASREGLVPIALLAAALLLALTPPFVQWSRASMSDLPAAALAALAVACALVYAHVKKLRWLFAAEVVLACALWVKLIAIGSAVVIVLALGVTWRERRGDFTRALVGTGVIAVLALVPLLAFDVRALFEQAIDFHFQKRAAYADQSLMDKAFILSDMLGANLSLSALAALGALMGVVNRATHQATFIALAWLGATALSLLMQTPLFANHHPVVLAFSLAALAGVGVAFAMGELQYVRRRRARPVTVSLAIVCILVALFGSVGWDTRLRAVLAPPAQPAAEEVVAMLDVLSAPSDLVVSDAQMIAFRAQREAPPALSDTSQARLSSGSLNAQDLIVAAQSADLILFWSGRIESQAAFVQWAEQNYRAVRSSFQKPNAPYRLLARALHPQHALDAQLGDGVHLLGYDLNRRSGDAVRGQSLSLTLYFERVAAIPQSYT